MQSVAVILLLSAAVTVLSHNAFYGTRDVGEKPSYREKVVYYAIPWKKRVKYYFYNNTEERPIKAILCYDYQHTEASVNITSGGIGHSFVNLRMKSQRSYGLEYAIEIYLE